MAAKVDNHYHADHECFPFNWDWEALKQPKMSKKRDDILLPTNSGVSKAMDGNKSDDH